MAKFVVDLKNLDINIRKVERVFNTINADLTNGGLVLASHDLNEELTSLKNFKTNLQQLFSKDIANKLITEAKCNEQLDNSDPNKLSLNPSPKDEYGNIYYPPPFEYDYVEIIYSNFELLEQVRLLGTANPLMSQGESLAGFLLSTPVRYYFSNLENRLSGITPTTLKILENLEEFTGKDTTREILRILRETIRKIDEACKKQLSSNNPDKWNISTTTKDIFGLEEQKNWKELTKKYFVPSIVLRQRTKLETTLDNLQRNLKLLEEQKEKQGITREEAQTRINDNIEKLKIQVTKQLEKERLETQISAKKEMPRAPVPFPKLDVCQPNTPQREDGQNKLLENKIEAWKRRHSLACIVKDIKDCYIPPNLDFCQVVFKDPSINTFLLKLQSLRAPGTSQIFDKITESIEDKLGVKELRESSEKIKNLEILLADEYELLSYYNGKLENFDSRLLNDLYPRLNGKKAAISLYNERITSGDLDSEQILIFNRKIASTQQQIEVIEIEIRTLTIERTQINARLETLKVNKDLNEQELQNLKQTYQTRIEELQFSQQQADLIRRGENLQAVFNAATQERLSDTQLFDTVIQAVDSIMPFENLCAMFFQLGFPSISFGIPEGLSEKQKLKNPFDGLYASWSRIITEFLIDVSLGFIDSLMASLCNIVDSAIANATDLSPNGPNYEKFTNDIINNGYSAIEPLLRGDYSSIVEFGVDKFNTKIELGFKNPLTSRLERPIEELCDDTPDIGPPIQPISVNISTKASGLLDFFLNNDRANPLAEWNISSDKKSFTYDPPPSLFDFSQIETFINNSVNEFLNPELGTGNFSLQSLIESFVNKGAGDSIEANNPCETTGPLGETDFAVASSEVSCLIRNAASLLTPSQMLEMLTGNPSEETKIIVSNLARICSPTITGRMGNNPSFLMSMMREVGTISGASDFLSSTKRLIDANNFLPTTTSVSCERYDNTRQFIQSLMAETIPDKLAKQILEKIEQKRIDNFNHILNTFASSNSGKIIAKPQDAIQFYLEIVDKLVEAKENGRNPESLEELGFQEPEKQQDRNIEDMLKAQDAFYKSQNPTVNSMLELVNESMFRPLQRTFKNDISSYINVMSGLKEVVKEEEIVEESQGQDVLSLEYLNSIFAESINVLKIPVSTRVEITDPSIVISARAELETIDIYKKDIIDKLRRQEPGNPEVFSIDDLINEIEEKYSNSNVFGETEKSKIADKTSESLGDLSSNLKNLNSNTNISSIENIVKLQQKRNTYADLNIPYVNANYGSGPVLESQYTNLGSSIDTIDKRQSVYPRISFFTGRDVSNSDDAGNFTSLDSVESGKYLPSQEELDGPPFEYHNPFGEDLCFLFNERNRTICHPYVLEMSMRAILAVCKYVRRTKQDGTTIEKWVIPTNMQTAPGIPLYSDNIFHLVERALSSAAVINIGISKSVNFYNSFDLHDVIFYRSTNDISNIESPYYNPQTDEILIETNQYNQKYQKTKLYPIIPPNTSVSEDRRAQDEQNIYSYCHNLLTNLSILQNNIDTYYLNMQNFINSYFDEVKQILQSKIKEIFKVIPPENVRTIKQQKISSWALPYEKQVGLNKIKTNRILLQEVNSENVSLSINSDTFPPMIADSYYISNGFTEDKYKTPFLTKDDFPSLVSYVTTSVNVVGEKFIENCLNIPNNTTIELEQNNFLLSINGTHGKSSGNPFLQNGNLFNVESNTNSAQQVETRQIIQTQFCEDDVITDISVTTPVGSIGTSKPPLRPPEIKEKCFNDIIDDPFTGIELPDRSDLRSLLRDSIPRWQLYYTEKDSLMELGLLTSGISFSTTGKKYNFYHDTIFKYNQEDIQVDILEKLQNKYNDFLSKTDAFYKFFNEKTLRDLNKILSNSQPQQENGYLNFSLSILNNSDNTEGSFISVDLSNLYNTLVERNYYKFIDAFKNNRLLQDYVPEDNTLLSIKEKDKISKKLLEMVPFTREQTDFEKQNGLDPNLIDFENIKEEFKVLNSIESSESLTEEQAIGRAASNSKTTKSAKNIFLKTLIRLCVVEHITKSIFLYDEIKFSKQCLNFSFVVKDIANFILQEATRFGVGGIIHRQADKLYRIKSAEGKIEDNIIQRQKFKKWNEEYSYDGKNASPRLIALVKLEYEKMLDKSSKILNCGSRGKGSGSIIRALLDEYKIYDAPNVYFSEDRFALLSQQGIGEKDFYFEKYVKLGRLNPSTEILFPELQFKIRNKLLSKEEVQNNIFSINDFFALCLNLTKEQKEKLFVCEDKNSGIFIDQPKVGIRLMLNVNVSNLGKELPLDNFSFNGLFLEKIKIFKSKSYCIFSDRFGSYSSEISKIQSNLIKENGGLRPWTEDEEQDCLLLFGTNCDEAVAERRLEDRRGEEEEFLAPDPVFSPEEDESLQGYEEEVIKINNLIVSEEELPLDLRFLDLDLENMFLSYDRSYLNILKSAISSNRDTIIMFKYCLVLEEILQLLIVNANLVHHDQNGRFLFESSKSYICDITKRLKSIGDKRKIKSGLNDMLEQQKEREDNTGSPLGPALEAVKFYYRTPIQILKGQATLVDPNIAIADKIVAGAAMAGSLVGQKIDIPYKLASLSLLPFPIFNGVAPPIPPLTAYNMAMPVGPVFLSLEHLLKDLPYYQNQSPIDEKTTDANSSNPFFCELLPEENDD